MKRLAIVNLLFFLAVSLYGQNLKSPDEFLGYELGTRFTPNYKVVDYFEYVAS